MPDIEKHPFHLTYVQDMGGGIYAVVVDRRNGGENLLVTFEDVEGGLVNVGHYLGEEFEAGAGHNLYVQSRYALDAVEMVVRSWR